MRSVCRISSFRAKFEADLLVNWKTAEHAKVQIHGARPAQEITSRSAEAHSNRSRERGRIEEWQSRSDSTRLFDNGLHLIRSLRIAGSIESAGCSRYGERSSGVGSKDAIDLP